MDEQELCGHTVSISECRGGVMHGKFRVVIKGRKCIEMGIRSGCKTLFAITEQEAREKLEAFLLPQEETSEHVVVSPFFMQSPAKRRRIQHDCDSSTSAPAGTLQATVDVAQSVPAECGGRGARNGREDMSTDAGMHRCDSSTSAPAGTSQATVDVAQSVPAACGERGARNGREDMSIDTEIGRRHGPQNARESAAPAAAQRADFRSQAEERPRSSGTADPWQADQHGGNETREELSADQQQAARMVMEGKNVFISGEAGAGKSFLLAHIIRKLRESFASAEEAEQAVAVTAPTGVAAVNIGGVTVHSWAGIGAGMGSKERLLQLVRRSKAKKLRWTAAEVLVVDEVSMLDSRLFVALNFIAQKVRRSEAPFGGLQLVLCGDFLQLPPVGLGRFGKRFCFETDEWRACGFDEGGSIMLTAMHRHGGDSRLAAILSSIRKGICSSEISTLLARCHVREKALATDGIIASKLYCYNKAAERENAEELARLPGEAVEFEAQDAAYGAGAGAVKAAALLDKKIPKRLRLKEGAQVMLTKNDPSRALANGSRGVVIKLSGGPDALPVVRFESGLEVAVHRQDFFQPGGGGGGLRRRQLPLRLGWAVTVHRAQGCTLDRAELQLDDAFDFGQVYVALSRVRSLRGLWLRGGDVTQEVVKAHPAALHLYAAAETTRAGAAQ